MIVRTYGRRSRSMSRSYSESGLNDDVSDHTLSQENSQDIYSFGFSSQDSVHWSSNFNNSDPYDVGSSQGCQELSILPARKEDRDLGFEGHDGVLWKPKKVKMFDWEPCSLNSSQESDEFSFLPDGGEYGGLGKFDGGLHEQKKVKKTGKGKENGVLQKKKKKKVKSKELGLPSLGPTATLMETQECGEMMEHMDEVNFALDGLRKGQPARIRRASLLSLLSICGTAQQRRLLRAHGMAKTIIDTVLGLSFDDSPSNLAAAGLFYILTSDGGDDHLLDSPSCIRFLIKLLRPVAAPASVAKAPTIGSKLLAMRLDADVTQDSVKGLDSTSSSITRKVQEVLISCKEIKPNDGNGHDRPELNPKWISLLTMAKACLSTISIEDTSGTVRRSKDNFKEKLRELGGLDAVFDVARSCHSVLEGWSKKSSQSILESKDNTAIESLVLLLKCLKIMENATFLSTDNQNHLLQMKGKFDSMNSPRSFTKLILSVIKILSGAYLCRTSLGSSNDGKVCDLSDGTARALELRSLSDKNDGSCQILCIDSSTTCYTSEGSCSQKNLGETQTDQIGSSISSLEFASTSTSDSWQLKLRIESSKSGSCSGTSEDFSFGVNKNSSKVNFLIGDNQRINGDKRLELMEESQDPFAFDDDFGPSRWDLMSTKQKVPETQIRQTSLFERDDEYQSLIVRSQQESSCQENKPESSSKENKPESSSKENNQSGQTSCSAVADDEMSTLLADCLLTAVKVLMNLTNDNPVGCQQIAAGGGLEALSALIASHFPSFSLHLDRNGSSKSSVGSDSDGHLNDQELDFLVAILGLLVNLVEKDGCNRSRLAAASISLPGSEGLFEGETQTDVIPLLCAIFLANQGAGEAAEEGKCLQWDDEDAVLQGEKEAEKMIIEAYSALLLAFLSTESKSIRQAIAGYLPDHKLSVLVPVLERFVDFHMTLNMISPETHSTVLEVIESCRVR